MGVRQYSETVGRFTTQDPLGFSSNSDNFYECVANNSMVNIDPTGLMTNLTCLNRVQNFLLDAKNAKSYADLVTLSLKIPKLYSTCECEIKNSHTVKSAYEQALQIIKAAGISVADVFMIFPINVYNQQCCPNMI
jgi:uncharacterized protein RhaS with RHS repeats